MRYAIPFSGGLDSTAGISEVLKSDPSGVLDIFHLQMRLRLPCLWIAQLNSALKILKYYRAAYPKAQLNFFTMSLDMELPRYDRIPMQDIIFYHLYMALRINKHIDVYEYILNCITADDRERGIGGWPQADKLLEIYAPGASKKLNRIFLGWDRFEVYKLIPKEIRDITWSCWHPQIEGDFIHSCGKCSKCVENNRLIIPNNIVEHSDLAPLVTKYKSIEDEIAQLEMEYLK